MIKIEKIKQNIEKLSKQLPGFNIYSIYIEQNHIVNRLELKEFLKEK